MKCDHDKFKQYCVQCASAGTGGSSICQLQGHNLARVNLCVRCAQAGNGNGKGICKVHWQRKSRCTGCITTGLCKTTELCEHGKRVSGSKANGCRLCRKKKEEASLALDLKNDPPSVGGTPHPQFEDPSPRA